VKAVFASVVLLLAGCATPVAHMNDPSRSTLAADLAAFETDESIPYETQSKEGLSVGYNLHDLRRWSNFSGGRLTLVIKNTSAKNVVIYPRITMTDANGVLVVARTKDDVLAQAGQLAGTQPPGSTFVAQSFGRLSAGEAFANGFQRGLANAAAARAETDRREGRLMSEWVGAYWLKDSYALPSGSAAVGALIVPRIAPSRTPITIAVEVNGETFLFRTAQMK